MAVEEDGGGGGGVVVPCLMAQVGMAGSGPTVRNRAAQFRVCHWKWQWRNMWRAVGWCARGGGAAIGCTSRGGRFGAKREKSSRRGSFSGAPLGMVGGNREKGGAAMQTRWW
jgi:hypothetical protein